MYYTGNTRWHVTTFLFFSLMSRNFFKIYQYSFKTLKTRRKPGHAENLFHKQVHKFLFLSQCKFVFVFLHYEFTSKAKHPVDFNHKGYATYTSVRHFPQFTRVILARNKKVNSHKKCRSA